MKQITKSIKFLALFAIVVTIGQSNVFAQSNFKSTTEYKQQLNSYFKQAYDSETQQMVNSLKYDYTYDANGKCSEKITYKWENDKWNNSKKYEYSYDADGNQTLMTTYDWGNTDWDKDYKYEYIYNNGNITAEIVYEWDYKTSEYINNKKKEYTYDGDGNLTVKITYLWGNSEWSETEKNEYTNYVNGNSTEIINYVWGNGDWEEYDKQNKTYDSNGNKIESITSDWDGSQWVNARKYNYTYDVNSNMTSYIYARWDSDVSDWANSFKYEYTYNIDGDLTLKMKYLADGDQWVENDKIDYTYDTNYLISEIYIPTSSFFGTSKHKRLGYQEYSKTDDNWIPKYSYSYSYSDIGADVTPPTVILTTPENGATGIAVDTVITITFSEAMNESSVVITGDLEGVSKNWVGNVLTITHSELGYSKNYTVTVNGSDLAGNQLTEYSFSFTTEQKEDVPSSIESTESIEISVYPNPVVTGDITVDMPVLGKKIVYIYSSAGAVVKMVSTELDEKVINVRDLQQGIYIVRVVSEQGVYNSKFRVE